MRNTQPPFLDYVFGHPLALLTQLGTLGYFLWRYTQGEDVFLFALLAGGVFVYRSFQSAHRVSQYRQFRREWDAVNQQGRAQGLLTRTGRAVSLTIYAVLALPLAFVAENVLAGMFGFEPALATPALLAAIDAIGFMAAKAEALAASPVVQRAGGWPAIAVVGVGAFVILWLLVKWRRGQGASATVQKRNTKGWKGSVQVLLPIPKK